MTGAAVLDVATTPRTPFSRLVRVELRKTYDTRAGFWLLAAVSGLVLVAETIMLLFAAANDEPVSLGDFVAAAALITSVMLPVLGILLVTSEWSQRTAMVTFALEPRRRLVIAAKLVTGVLLTIATALVATVLGVIVNAISFGIRGEGSWEFEGSLLVGFLLVQSLTMVGGFALATLFLNTPAALIVFFVYKWALPGVLFAGAGAWDWLSDVGPWINLQAALDPLTDLSLDTGEEWGQLLVSGAVWLALPLALGVLRILRAEVK